MGFKAGLEGGEGVRCSDVRGERVPELGGCPGEGSVTVTAEV